MFAPLRALRKLAEFVKFSHTVFALPFALAAMALAARDNRGWPGWRTFLLILLAMVGARTCAMAFNRIVDRKFDAANPRTALRHLATGEIPLAGAWALCLAGAAALVIAAWLLNPVCFYLSPVALFAVCFYSLTKRFTDFTHFFLGAALALAPLGAWLAVTGGLEFFPTRDGALSLKHSAFVPLLLALAVVFWLVGFDIIYAIQDYEFDRRQGLHSLVVRWGVKNALQAAFLAHVFMWLLLALLGVIARFWAPYLVGLLLILGCLLVEHWLARKRSLKWVNTAFFRMNALISAIFLVIVVAEVVFPRFMIQTR
ncbi:MAG: UbiA family prenyltransferase [Verrucomicrobia bacterium]|nr:UbiA family prenyltransferase [Verrucomicrobiota bacterium]